MEDDEWSNEKEIGGGVGVLGEEERRGEGKRKMRRKRRRKWSTAVSEDLHNFGMVSMRYRSSNR